MAADVHGGKAVHGHAAIALDPSAEWNSVISYTLKTQS